MSKDAKEYGLRNCPFCNSANIQLTCVTDEWWYAKCDDCGSRTGVERNVLNAASRWNGLEVKDE